MPSTSKKQSKFMTANCKSPKFRKKTGVSKKVACDYHKKDKGEFHESINKIPNKIWSFLNELDPSDIGYELIDNYLLAFEGFEDDCFADAERRIKSGEHQCIEDIYNEVIQEWIKKFKTEPIQWDLLGDETPILWAIFPATKEIKNKIKKSQSPTIGKDFSIFDSLMTQEDMVKDKVKKAKDLLDKHPRLADILLEPLKKDPDILTTKRKENGFKLKEEYEKNIEEFLEEFWNKSDPHPLNNKSRLIGPILIQLVPKMGNIHIADIMNLTDVRRGYATEVMKFIISLADKHNVKLTLLPEAYGKKVKTQVNKDYLESNEKLKQWYEKLGFKDRDKGYYMEYDPNRSLNENFRPSTFLKVGRNLVELQTSWLNEEEKQIKVDVFVQGRGVGHYTFSGKNYMAEDEKFKTVEEAIAYLIEKNRPSALPRTNPSNILLTYSNMYRNF